MSIQSNINQTMMVAASLASAIKSMDELDKLTNTQQSRIVDKYKKVRESSGLRGAINATEEAIKNKDDIKVVDTREGVLEEPIDIDMSKSEAKDYDRLVKIMSSDKLSPESKKRLTGSDMSPKDDRAYYSEYMRNNMGKFNASDYLSQIRNKGQNAVNDVNMRSLYANGYNIDNITTYDDWGSID